MLAQCLLQLKLSIFLAGLTLAAACVAPGATATPTSAPAALTPVSPATTANPGPPTAASPSPSPAGGTGGIRLTMVPEGSEARFRVREQLVGRPLPGDAVGSTRAVSGGMLLSPTGAIVPEQSKIEIDVRSLRSDESRRDNFIHRNVLESQQFPSATFIPKEARGAPFPLPTTGEASFQLLGDLTAHGVTRPVSWDVTAQFAEQEISGSASTTFMFRDYNMEPPRIGPVLSVEDGGKLEIDFRVSREAVTGGASPARGPLGSTSQQRAPGALPNIPSAPAAMSAPCEPTRVDSLGPFYKPNAPARSSVGNGYALSGSVRAASGCRPLAGAQIEFWLANAQGVYDDAHRAMVLAGSAGEYRFESNPPPPYAGRPPHIHIRITATGFQPLVTQHYPQSGEREAVFDLVLVG